MISHKYFTDEHNILQSPVYYLPEAPEALHADRGPYSFEPAASGLQPPVGEDRVAEQRPTIISASNDDFVIKQHSYQMCPTCPTFTIPIPIPKAPNFAKISQYSSN